MRILGTCICILFFFQVVFGSKIEWVRGVSPPEQIFYKTEIFKCRNEPSRQIPASRVNDNYCDCADGSDEPGTSACANGIFYCTNKGYKGVTLFSAQVNDGICDCCDGSDEYSGKVNCKNNCQELGVELRQQQQAEKHKHETGLQTKQQWIQEAAKSLSEKRDSIDALRAEVDKLKKVVDDLEAEKRGFEEKERVEKEAIAERKKELERLELETQQQEAPSEAQEQEQLKELLKQQGEQQQQQEEQQEHGEENEEEDLRMNPVVPQPEEETELLKTIREGKRKIEDELSQARRDLSTAENSFRSTEDILKMDFGANNEFYVLNGNCYDAKTREYTYSFCPYGEVKQAHTSLGKFENWDPAYSVMSFTNGQQCWGGPKRSARITFFCGSENELYDVQEPSKCEYHLKFNTPAACAALPLEFLDHSGEHDSYFP